MPISQICESRLRLFSMLPRSSSFLSSAICSTSPFGRHDFTPTTFSATSRYRRLVSSLSRTIICRLTCFCCPGLDLSAHHCSHPRPRKVSGSHTHSRFGIWHFYLSSFCFSSCFCWRSLFRSSHTTPSSNLSGRARLNLLSESFSGSPRLLSASLLFDADFKPEMNVTANNGAAENCSGRQRVSRWLLPAEPAAQPARHALPPSAVSELESLAVLAHAV